MPTLHDAETIWFLLGAALMVSELVTPGFILFFFGLGAWMAAMTTWLGLTPGLPGQLAVFLVSSIASLVLLRRYGKAWFKGKELPKAHAETLTGDVRGEKALVVEPIAPGALGGKVELFGTRWNAVADEALAPGETVEVAVREGLTLKVRRPRSTGH